MTRPPTVVTSELAPKAAATPMPATEPAARTPVFATETPFFTTCFSMPPANCGIAKAERTPLSMARPPMPMTLLEDTDATWLSPLPALASEYMDELAPSEMSVQPSSMGRSLSQMLNSQFSV